MQATATPSPEVILAELDSRARRIETPCGYGSIVWRCWGEGPPLLLFHGSHGSWSHWIRNIPALAAHRTVWAVDLPGFGESDMPLDISHESISDTLVEGIRQLPGLDLPVDIAGFSFGGVVAAFLSVAHPELVRRLVLIGTGGLDTPVGALQLQRVRGLEGDEREAAHRHNILTLMLHHPDSVDDLSLYLQELNGVRGRFNPVNLVLPDRLLRILEKTRAPFDVIWGEFDGPHPDPAAQEKVLRAICPGMAFRTIAGAGHWVMYERPEEFNRMLLELLEGAN